MRVSRYAADIVLEPGHCERLYRSAAYAAIRDGLLAPGETVRARLVSGRVRDHHGEVACLDSCAVELLDGQGRLVNRVEFPGSVFSAFAVARGVNILAAAEEDASLPVAYSLHAHESDDEPLVVAVPDLPAMSVAALAAGARAYGDPEDGWAVTFITPAAAAGFEELGQVSRASGVEAAGRIHTRLGFDPKRRCFVRVLERMVVSRLTLATAVSVVSTAASWGDFLTAGDGGGIQAPASAHTHLHLSDGTDGGEGAAGDHLLAASSTLRAADDPCISIRDIVTHYTAYPDPMSTAVIVSLFPGRQRVTLYGYTAQAQLRVEPGYWLLNG